MTTALPILLGHDPDKIIGYVETAEGGRLFFRLTTDLRITREMFFEIFGNCGVRFTEGEAEEDGTLIVRSGEILEFSLSPVPAAQGKPGA